MRELYTETLLPETACELYYPIQEYVFCIAALLPLRYSHFMKVIAGLQHMWLC